MYLLSGQSLTKADWFMPEKMGLNLEERRSTATLTLGPEAPAISGGDWLLDETEPGAGIVWRVKTINTQYDTNTRTATLEHIAATLQDLLMFGDTKATAMRASGSTAPAGKCYAEEAIDYILSKHSLWTKGSVAAAYSTVSNPYNFNGDNLFAALETVTSSLEGCYWEFDLSAIPFKIHFRQLSQDVDSEMRMGRNITTLRRTVDTSRMYTRFYPIGKKDLHVTGNYVSRNENLYGVIEKVETDQSKTTAEELTAWANERLRKHAEPSVTVTISGQELSAATGEALDHFTINKQCRVPLPEYGTTITEKVTKLSWSDKITAPEAVTVTLANLREDLASIINNANAAGARGGRVSATEAKEDHAWIVDTEDHVAIIAEAVGGSVVMDGQEVNWSRVASILVDGNGIHQQVTEAAGDATLSKSWIDQNGQNVLAGVQKVGTLEDKAVELEGRLDLEAGKASLLVTATDNRTVKTYTSVSAFPATGSASYLYYSLGNKKYYEWTNGAYSETTPGNTINRAGIVSTINEDGSSTTKILGTKVSIGGANSTVSLSDVLETLQGDVLHVKKNAYYDKEVTIANVSGAGLNLYTLNFVGASTYTLTPPDVANMIAKAQVDSGTNTLKLWTYADKSNQAPTLSFSKATSTSLSGSWSGDVFTVLASPQGDDYDLGFGTNYGTHDKDFEVVVKANSIAKSSIANSIDIPLAINELQSGQTPPVEKYTRTATANISGLLQTETVTPASSEQTKTPDATHIGFSSVTVAGDEDLVGSNIKKGVGIFGVTGTYPATSDIDIYKWQYKSNSDPGSSFNPLPSGKSEVKIPLVINKPDAWYELSIDVGSGNYVTRKWYKVHIEIDGKGDCIGSNIRSGKTICGVKGTYSGGGSSSSTALSIVSSASGTSKGTISATTINNSRGSYLQWTVGSTTYYQLIQ